jgi:hypothetical protein
MQEPKNQYETEEQLIRESLLKVGYSKEEIDDRLFALKNDSPQIKGIRNVFIREISDILKNRPYGMQAWYVQEILSKVTGLSPKYIQVIANTLKSLSLIKGHITEENSLKNVN